MQTEQAKRYFWWFVLIHCSVWLLLPAIMRYALPHDTIEAVLWGKHLEWGYDKNPWVNTWLTRLGQEIGGMSGIGIYALSSFFVGLSFWSVWKLAGKIVSPAYALVSVLLLEGCVNYTLVPQGFNDNIVELGLWPLMFLCFYNAIDCQKIQDWIMLGLTAGFAMMAKYYTGIPLLIMALFLLLYKKGRASFCQAGLYIGALVFIGILLPHIFWLFQHDFITLKYAFNRAASEEIGFWKLHFYYPFNFAFTQILNFLFPLIVVLCWRYFSLTPAEIRNNKVSIACIVWFSLGPLILTVLLAVICGWRLYNEWGVPLVSLWGLLLIILFKPRLNEKNLKSFIILTYGVMALWAVGYVTGLFLDNKHKHSDNYPARDIVHYITEEWQKRYTKPLRYVAGSRYIGGYVAFYAKDHPEIYVEWNEQFSPWINVKEMKKYGAVFVQDNYYGTTVFGKHPDTMHGKQFPKEVLQQFPHLIILPVKYFYWKRGNKDSEPIPVLVGFLPPEAQ